MNKYLIIFLIMASLQIGFSQDKTRMHDQIESQKVAFFTQQLELTPGESQAFWPVYNNYQEKVKELRGDVRHDKNHSELSEEEAAARIDQFFERESRELEYKKQLYRDLDGILPPTKLVKLQFAEKQFRQKLLEKLKGRKGGREKR